MSDDLDTLEEAADAEDLLHDGYGNSHSRVCPTCGNVTMYIALPNDFRCRLCYTESYKSVDF